jgi:hypothetical protein
LRVLFAAQARPQLPDGVYFDAHVHTVAEWTHTDRFDLLAARKNMGGPIPMVKECSLAVGLTDALDATSGRVITTDHNFTYYDRGAQDDDVRHRPPYGPTAVANSNGRSEWQRMEDIFGLTRGEEVTFHSSATQFFGISLPTGAHMLKYRAEHIDGPWHGGSSIARALGDASPDVDLRVVLDRLASQNRTENKDAAIYGAHPFSSSLGWQPEHFDLAFGRDPLTRSDVDMHVEQTGFVAKGLQLWNGDSGRHDLDSSKIDWNDLNPYADADFNRGHADWDGSMIFGLTRWHEDLSKLLAYELKARPGVRFPRKVFIAAGNDAHGDFNFTESRAAAILSMQNTFKVDSRAYGRCLTYALPDDREPHATPAERAFEAYLDGSSVLTDGPLVTVALDAEDRFDGEDLTWHDATPSFEDRDGRIGGGGAFDGAGTALVRRGSPAARLGYRYLSTAEFGDVTTVEVYRTSVGDPNPAGRKPSGGRLLLPRGRLAATAAGQDLSERLDAAEEGLITSATALHVGAFTDDPATMAADGARCLTNPVWAIPFDVDATVARTETDPATGKGSIPAGALTVRLTFDMSMTAKAYRVELKALDATGASTDKTVGPIDELLPTWSDLNGVKDCVLELTNQRPIPLDLDRYGAAGNVTFVVYTFDRLEDPFGNALHRVAATFEAPGIGTGGGTGPALPRAGSGSTASPATATPTSGGGGGGGGCSLATSTTTSPTPLALMAILLLLALRRRHARTV